MDPKGPKNKSSWNRTKLTPLRRSCRADSDNIFFSSENGHGRRKLSCSELFPKQTKIQRSKSTSQRPYI
jgi:hypothetical protein